MENDKDNKLELKTSFVEVMGDYPINRVLDFLIENDRTEWSLMEIVEGTGIGYSTLKKLMPHLLEKEIIVTDRQIGKAKLYKMNKESGVVKKLYQLYKTINAEEFAKVLNTGTC